MKKENILEVNNLSISFNSEKIIDDISFSVRRGEALAIIGPNGAGKTVLLRALLGLVPYEGSVAWAKNIKVGYIPQKFFTTPGAPLTVKEFFLLQAKNFWMPRKYFISHLEHELDLVGLPKNILKDSISGLSGGQLQRLLLAWAMLNHPNVLLCDEPTAGIDVGFEETIYHLIQNVQKERGATVIIISHDLHLVYHYAQDVLCINKKMICNGPPLDVLHPKELAALYGEGKFYVHKHEGGNHKHH